MCGEQQFGLELVFPSDGSGCTVVPPAVHEEEWEAFLLNNKSLDLQGCRFVVRDRINDGFIRLLKSRGMVVECLVIGTPKADKSQ